MTRFPRIPIAFALVLAITASCPGISWAVANGGTGAEPDEPKEDSRALIATADFNRDGIADLAKIIRPDGNRIGPSVLEISYGTKDGSFAIPVNHTLDVQDPRSIAAGDFNGDGNPDLLIGQESGRVIELCGDGKGDLKLIGEVAHVGSVVSMAVGDFNRDGIPDVAISDFRGNAVAIFLNAGGGTFRTGWSFALPQRGTAYYLTAADFNADGVSDLVITSGREDVYVVMLGNGNGTFTYAPKLSNIPDPYSYCPT